MNKTINLSMFIIFLQVVIDPNNYYEKEENIYELKIGIRNIEWNSKGLWLNGQKLYLRGFGKHEDSEASMFIYNYIMQGNSIFFLNFK